MFDDCIIMAGGSGARLWPASHAALPKQFLPGPGGKSFFRLALERGLAVASGQVIIIAGKDHARHVTEAAASLDEADRARIVLVIEPLPKNTAPAIACGAILSVRLAGNSPDAPARNIIVLSSDHIIDPPEDFRAAADAAARYAGEHFVVFGIPPERPETGYGYIEAAEPLEPGAVSVYRAASFREKPDRKTAEQFVRAGNFYWNSGMFGFSAAVIIEEFRRFAPDIIAPFEALTLPTGGLPAGVDGIRVLDVPREAAGAGNLAGAYAAVRADSIDYAVAEKCRRVVMTAGRFRWLDVGSWDAYAPLRAGAVPDVYAVPPGAAESCFVDSEIPVALCGVEDLVVVIRTGKDGGPAAALIARKGETQQVRNIVEEIKRRGKTELL